MSDAAALFLELNLAGTMEENSWRVRQTDRVDRLTSFIYVCSRAEDLESRSAAAGLSAEERAYAVHRWRNFKRHEAWMTLLRETMKEMAFPQSPFEKTTDFSLRVQGEWTPFDLKVTRYPASLPPGRTDAELAVWFYRNQSRQQRYHLANRFFVVGQPELALYDFLSAKETVAAFAARIDEHCHEVRLADTILAKSIVLRHAAERAA